MEFMLFNKHNGVIECEGLHSIVVKSNDTVKDILERIRIVYKLDSRSINVTYRGLPLEDNAFIWKFVPDMRFSFDVPRFRVTYW